MRILTIADYESPFLWDFFEKEKVKDVDLILSAGDLNPAYLSFLVTLSTAPVLYVRGNHDGKYDRYPPDGCVCIEDKIYVHEGIRILGLGGSMEYTGDANQYTERAMRRRAQKLWLSIRYHRGFDILLTHAPAYGLNDGEDLPHRGFQVFNTLMDNWEPKYFIHGHVHKEYTHKFKRLDQYGETKVINAYERYEFEYEEG